MGTILKVAIVVVAVIIALIAIAVAAVVYPFYTIIDQIDDINMADSDAIKANFKAYPESEAFLAQHPELTSEELYDLGLDYEYWLITDEATLRIDHNKETDESLITYICEDVDGNPMSYDGDDLVEVMATLC